MSVVSLLTTTLTAYMIGARNVGLLFAVVLGVFPIAMAVSVVARRLIPPKLTLSDDYKLHLYETDPAADGQLRRGA